MIPPEFTNFFLASAGAAAALIGLLFVAVSIAPEHTVMAGAPLERQAVAAGSFTALINAFFISLGALIPGINLGSITLAMSLVGISSSLSMAWVLLRHRSSWSHTLRRAFMAALSLTLYGYELYDAVLLLQAPSLVPLVYTIAILLLCIYGIALARAWELLGARRFGFLNNWLNPVRDTNDSEIMAKPDQSTSEKRL